MKLGVRDRIIITIFGLIALIYCAYNFVIVPTSGKVSKLHEEKVQVEGLSADITPIMEQVEKLQSKEKELAESVDNIKTLDGGATAVNEEFLVFLGDSAKKNNVSVIGYNDLGTDEANGVYTSTYDFELRGNTQDINKVLEDIDGIGIKCSYGSVSLRQNENTEYLKRFFDNFTDLPWYKEPEEEKDVQPETPEVKPPAETVEPVYPAAPYVPSVILPEEPVAPAVPDVPEKTEPAPNEKTDKKDESINDRLNRLLEQTAANGNYEIIFLAGTENGTVQYKQSQMMRLAVTVKLIMFREPSADTSFLKRKEAKPVEVL